MSCRSLARFVEIPALSPVFDASWQANGGS